MTYAASEAGVVTGLPIELCEFRHDTTYHRYTSAATDQEYLGHTFTAVAMHRSEVEDTGNADRGEISIIVPRDNPFAIQFIAAPVEFEVFLTYYRGHGSDFVVYWTGKVAAVRFDTDQAMIVGQPHLTDVEAMGLRRVFCRTCTYPLYGDECGVNNAAFVITGTVATASGLTITSTAFASEPDGWLQAGMIYTAFGSRMIKTHVSSTITVSHAIPGLVAGSSFRAYAGCDHSMSACDTKFGNVLNYGGQPWLPTNNPFEVSIA
jgi:uncharacterized phage protein (TIGR02218 family)